jgi:zinc D-Ala-D-Ala carboxypeptidase
MPGPLWKLAARCVSVSCVKSGSKEGANSVFDAARKARRRRRWFFTTVLLVCALAVGYAVSQTSLFAPLAIEAGETAVVKEPPPPPPEEIERDREPARKQAASPPPPAPEESCDDLRVLVDQTHPLPYYYEPRDLVSLSAYGVPVYGGDMFLREEAAGQLGRLMAAAAADGEELLVASAYRSYADQQSSYAKWESFYGQGAGGMSAPPGHSQHQLGTAVDFTNAQIGYQINQEFGDTSGALWLEENAPRFGFVLAYPAGAFKETGYNWEPWHFRYIGEANVERLEASGLSLQGFLVREGVLPRC